MLRFLCSNWIFLLISLFLLQIHFSWGISTGFTFIMLSLLFIRSQKAGKDFVPGDSGELARGEIKAVDIVLQLWCLVTPTLVLMLVLCFWASGKYSVPSGQARSW